MLLQDKNLINYPVLIEYKGYKDKLVKLDSDGKVANKTNKNLPDFKAINSYAVNGAVHYANALLHYTSYTDIIAIGMTGHKDDTGKLQHEIGAYYVSKSNFGIGQKIDDYTDLSFLKKENFDSFIERVKQLQLRPDEIEKLREHREREIQASLVKLNNDIYQNEKGLSERDRVYLVAASIIATLGVPGKVAALENAQFFLSSMRKTFASFAWGSSSFNVDTLNAQIVKLPVKNNKIDFDFMESFIAELETEQLAKLSAYLTVSGLDNYELSQKEKAILIDFNNIQFCTFDVTDIFDIKNTNNIMSRDIIENSGKTPYLCAGSENNCVKSYISYNNKYIDKGNCIFIGGKTFVVSYQEEDFYSNDSHNLALYLRDKGERTKLKQLCLATCVKKSMQHKYSWGNSVSYRKITKDKIFLPTKDGKPDYPTMEILISAVQKLVIKDVVLYSNKRVKATREIIAK